MTILNLIQLIILFLVIFNPLHSLFVFISASSHMTKKQRKKTAFIAILVAASLSFTVLLIGPFLLTIFSTNINEFKVAGGIILAILGINMVLGHPIILDKKDEKRNSVISVASIIGTPLLTGPATITAIILAINDYGRIMTGTAIAFVLFFTSLIFLLSDKVHKFFGETTIQIISTILGLIIISWGVKFIASGLQAIF
jgi:multiple antibiotic resistance protein